jgi:ATP-dependent Clp protease ATP-binding subunit ClpA
MFAADLKLALTAARDEASRLAHSRIEPLHLALGVLSVPQPALDAVLPAAARADVCNALRPRAAARTDASVWKFDIPYTDEARVAIRDAHVEARTSDHAAIGSGHLLCALLVAHGSLRDVLDAHGISVEQVRVALRGAPDRGAP